MPFYADRYEQLHQSTVATRALRRCYLAEGEVKLLAGKDTRRSLDCVGLSD